jgi:hypothetical protein
MPRTDGKEPGDVDGRDCGRRRSAGTLDLIEANEVPLAVLNVLVSVVVGVLAVLAGARLARFV